MEKFRLCLFSTTSPVMENNEDVDSLLSVRSVQPSPNSLSSKSLLFFYYGTLLRFRTELVARLRILTVTLLPVEADTESINDPTSRIITPHVISAYVAAAGDFVEAVCLSACHLDLPELTIFELPYCLLRARRDFIVEANRNPADYGENYGRAIACEVLARRVVHQAPVSSRFG